MTKVENTTEVVLVDRQTQASTEESWASVTSKEARKMPPIHLHKESWKVTSTCHKREEEVLGSVSIKTATLQGCSTGADLSVTKDF